MKPEQLALSEIQRLINPAATAIAPIRSLPDGWQSIFTAEGRSFLVQCRGDSYQVLAVPPGIVERSDRSELHELLSLLTHDDAAPCGKGWEGTKPPGCKRSGGSSKAAKTNPAKTVAAEIEPKKKDVPGKVANNQNPDAKIIQKFGEISDRAEFNNSLKLWSPDIKTVNIHAEIAAETVGIDLLKAKVDKLKTSPIGQKVKVYEFGKNGFPEAKLLSTADAVTFFENKTTESGKKIARLQKKAPKSSTVDGDRVVAASTIYNDMKDSLKDKKNKAGGVKGEDGEMSAAYTYRAEKDHVYLDYLVTAPSNLLDGGKGVKGAGSQAVKNVVQKSVESGFGGKVKLMALEDAIPFYKKLGFEPDEEGSEYMTLSPQAAKKLLSGK